MEDVRVLAGSQARPQLSDLLRCARDGDAVRAHKMDRLPGDLNDMCALLRR